MNKGYMTFAADMVLLRQERFQEKVNQLILAFQVSIMMGKFDSRERIVNHDGKVISRWVSA